MSKMAQMSLKSQSATETPPLPWEYGVFDAHCHPTDTMTSISDIPQMRAAALTIMSTRGEDQELVDEVAKRLGSYRPIEAGDKTTTNNATTPGKVIPCFGWHPWFAHQISIESNEVAELMELDKLSHYRSVLTGSAQPGNARKDDYDDEAFFKTLPNPKPLSVLLTETRHHLLSHPNALVGEVGLDKVFRLPMPWQKEEIKERNAELTPGSREGRKLSPYKVAITHQKALLKAQLQLAGEMRRAVSVHSVQAHGAVFEVLQELWKGHERKPESKRQRKERAVEEMNERLAAENEDSDEEREHEQPKKAEGNVHDGPLPFPPRICMHSYSGPPDALVQFLRPTVPSDVYFSFSTVINFAGPTMNKVVAALRALPEDRILVESDLHCAGQQMDDLLEEAVRTVCATRGWSLEDGTRKLAENWKRFAFG